MMMSSMKMITMCFLVLTANAQLLHAYTPTVPAFLWSPQHHRFSSSGVSEAVNYQTISSKELAKSILSHGSWSNLVCPENGAEQSMDVAIVFVGRELLSSDISANKNADSALLNLLKDSFSKSNFSMAFPYVAAPVEQPMERVLISEFAEACGQELRISDIAFSESCSTVGKDIQKLADLQAINGYLTSRIKGRPNGKTQLVVVCQQSSHPVDQQQSEGEVFSGIISSVETLGAKYAVLYVSDPLRPIWCPTHQDVARFLTETGAANFSSNSTTCDGVCQIKKSLLEGILVGIVLLIILISGLCCMMGIDTPTRFEAPQES